MGSPFLFAYPLAGGTISLWAKIRLKTHWTFRDGLLPRLRLGNFYRRALDVFNPRAAVRSSRRTRRVSEKAHSVRHFHQRRLLAMRADLNLALADFRAKGFACVVRHRPICHALPKKMVRSSGFEPPRYCYRQPLKLVRLPVPPRPQRTYELHYEVFARKRF